MRTYLAGKLYELLKNRVALQRPPDFVIGDNPSDPYLSRWWVIPKNKIFNIYLHHFQHSDDDRALHSHPWVNMSILLKGSYIEHTKDAAHVREEGHIYCRLPSSFHRVELTENEYGRLNSVWTLFITGPRVVEWFFDCAEKGLVHWKEFTRKGDTGKIGKGCGD